MMPAADYSRTRARGERLEAAYGDAGLREDE
jgi:hypothetical protein